MENLPPITSTVHPRPSHEGPTAHEFLGTPPLPVITKEGVKPRVTPHTFITSSAIPHTPSANFSPIDDGGVDTNSDEIGAKRELSSEKIRMHKFYHFLCSIPVMTLRRIAKEWNCRQYGLKKVLVARIFLFATKKVLEEDCLLDDLLKTCDPMPDFNIYLSNAPPRVIWDEPPSKAELLRIVGVAVDDIDVTEALDFTLSELARLLVVMRNDVTVKQSIYQSRFTSSNGDGQISDRPLFWESIIQAKFNDESNLPSFHPFSASLDPVLIDVNPSAPPTRFRSAMELMEQFYAVRTSFRYYENRWLKFGGDSTNFIDVLPQNDVGRRMLVVFHIMGYSTSSESEDARLLGFTTGSDEYPSRRCRVQSTDEDRGVGGEHTALKGRLRRIRNDEGPLRSSLTQPINPGGVIANEQTARKGGRRKVSNNAHNSAGHEHYPGVETGHGVGQGDIGGGGADDDETDVGSYVLPIARPKRRRRFKSHNEDEDNAGVIRSLVQALRSPLPDNLESSEQCRRDKEEKVQTDLRLAQVQLQSAQVQLQSMQVQLQLAQVQFQSSLINSISNVQRMLPEHNSDPDFKAITQIIYQNMKEEIFKMRHQQT